MTRPRKVRHQLASFHFFCYQLQQTLPISDNNPVDLWTTLLGILSLATTTFCTAVDNCEHQYEFAGVSYVRHGANSGMAAWTRHRKDVSVDSVMSDFSGMHLGRPGLGDKMFSNNAAADHGPLTSISASPPESAIRPHVGNHSSFDSIIDDEQRLSQDDLLFEKTHYRSSMSSDSVFGDDYSFQNDGLFPPNQLFRPLSVHSIGSIHSPMKEDDTMISVSITSNFFCWLQS